MALVRWLWWLCGELTDGPRKKVGASQPGTWQVWDCRGNSGVRVGCLSLLVCLPVYFFPTDSWPGSKCWGLVGAWLADSKSAWDVGWAWDRGAGFGLSLLPLLGNLTRARVSLLG